MKKLRIIALVVVMCILSSVAVNATCPTHGNDYLYQYCSDVVSPTYPMESGCPLHDEYCYRYLYFVYTWEYCQDFSCDHYLDDREDHIATSTHTCLVTHTRGSNEILCAYY